MAKQQKGRKGVTLVETIAAVVILTLLFLVVARLTATKITEVSTIGDQYSLQTVDGFLSDIYHDFHSCAEFKVDTEFDTDAVYLTFTFTDGVAPVIYEYNRVTGYCYKDGRQLFECSTFEADGAGRSLSVVIKLPNEKRLEMNVFR